MLFTVASFGRALVPIGAIFACRMRWIGPKTAVSVVFTNYIVLQYTVMLARCAVHRIAEVEQPGWFWAIATSGILAVLCLAVWLA